MKRKPRPHKASPRYVFMLYVTGNRPLSTRAIKNLRAFAEAKLKGRYRLQVIDLYQRPDLAKKEGIMAAPTLVKTLPLPLRRMIGDLSDLKKLAWGLDLDTRK